MAIQLDSELHLQKVLHIDILVNNYNQTSAKEMYMPYVFVHTMYRSASNIKNNTDEYIVILRS